MTNRIYTLYDTVSQSIIGALLQQTTDAAAIRVFADTLRAPETPLNLHMADYNLLFIGEIDQDGTIANVPNYPTVIARGADILENLKRAAYTPETAQ